jgi:hypothetical protein
MLPLETSGLIGSLAGIGEIARDIFQRPTDKPPAQGERA